MVTAARARVLLLNIGHFLDHFFMLVFATAAALTLTREWGLSYDELIPYATPGFVAYAVCSLPAGWLADRWSRDTMMTIFFVGIGVASVATALADSPLQIAVGLALIGVFAAIYHPVGIALIIEGHARTGVPLAVNGVFGNLGVASAALITGFLIDNAGWRAAFVWPGLVSVAVGVVHHFVAGWARSGALRSAARPAGVAHQSYDRAIMLRVLAVVFFTTAMGGMVFQSTTFSLPKVFDERLAGLAVSATQVGWYAFLVFAVAAVGQLIVGFLIDRHSVRYVFMGLALLQTAMFAAMPGQTGWPALLIAFAFMLAVFGQVPINDALVGRVTRNEWRSRVLALRYILSFSVTALAIPAIAWIYGVWGFDRLFAILAVTAGLIFAGVAMLPRLRAVAVPAE
jgi:MFS family permease